METRDYKMTLQEFIKTNDDDGNFICLKLDDIKEQHPDLHTYKGWLDYGKLNVEVGENEKVYLWEYNTGFISSGGGYIIVDNNESIKDFRHMWCS